MSATLVNTSIPGPHDIHRKVLSNGITLLVRSNFNSASVVISGILGAGSQFDPLEKLGLAHFTSVSLMRGTKNADFQTIFERLESAGASLGFGASVHNTSLGGRALIEDMPMLISTLADSLLNPTFPELYFDRLKQQLLTGLAIRAQDTSERASLAFDTLLFPNHPYGFPEDGYTETISAISRQDLVDFHAKHFGPDNMVVVVVGAVKPEDVFSLFEKEFGVWKNPGLATAKPFAAINPLQKTLREHISLSGKSQTDIVMGTLGPKRSAPEYLAASLGNNILGQFGMMGRIGDVVREKAGLAYYASTSVSSWIEGGSWEVAAGVNPANTDKAIHLIIQELEKFRSEPVLQSELDDSQANYIGRLPLSLESNSGVANSILNLERFNLGLDYFQRYPDLVREVTTDQILKAAQKYIDPERLVIASAGPGKGKKK
ncbi:MAG: pitrilysin family protein [Anaerolineaceae bacterium]|nr:pitrilysin family protein [Anaerolineaceae bacterium]